MGTWKYFIVHIISEQEVSMRSLRQRAKLQSCAAGGGGRQDKVDSDATVETKGG